MPEDTITNPAQFNGMVVDRITFNHTTYPKSQWKINASLRRKDGSYQGARSMDIELNGDIAETLLKALLPFIVESASRAAQELADHSKQLVNGLSECITKQLPPASN